MKKIGFESLRTKRATDVIETRISNMIVQGEIKPGEKLPTEKELSYQFDVSIATIREALRGLEVAGLIEKRRGKGGGIYATRISSDSLKATLNKFLKRVEFTADQLTEVRLMIEPAMIKKIVSQITPAEIKSLENNVIYCENKLKKVTATLTQKEYADLGEKNLEFHRLIAEATHNPAFMLTIDYLMDFIYEFRKSVFTPSIKHVTRVVEDHRDIFTSLKEGDPEQAEAKMLSHLKYLDMYQEEQHLALNAKKR